MGDVHTSFVSPTKPVTACSSWQPQDLVSHQEKVNTVMLFPKNTYKTFRNKSHSEQLFYYTLYMLTLPLTMNAPMNYSVAQHRTNFILYFQKWQTARVEDGYAILPIDCSHKPPIESFIPLKIPLHNLRIQIRGLSRYCALMSLLLLAARTHMKNIFRHQLLTPEFEGSIWLLWGNWKKNNDKMYYSINLPSSKRMIFFDTVHNSVWARAWRENNRVPLIVWGHFVWIILLSLVYYVSCQKLKLEF